MENINFKENVILKENLSYNFYSFLFIFLLNFKLKNLMLLF
jgi:hypothetical protein